MWIHERHKAQKVTVRAPEFLPFEPPIGLALGNPNAPLGGEPLLDAPEFEGPRRPVEVPDTD